MLLVQCAERTSSRRTTMTMSSDLVSANCPSKPGWFDSLRRQKKTAKRPPASPLSPAKSLSSLAAHAVQPTLNGQLARSTNAVNANSVDPAKLPPKAPRPAAQKLGWRSLLHLNRRAPSVEQVAVSASALPGRQHARRDGADQSGFLTLPRKRAENATRSPNHVLLPLSTSMDAVSSAVRSRAASAAAADGQRKRSTVWYTQSDSDVVLNRNNNRKQLKDEIAEVTAEMESMDNGEESKNTARAKQLTLGRKKFNMDPKKGIEFLVQQGLLQNTPQDIAAFLYRGEGLNKTAIGDYLGEKSPFHEQVLKAFVDLHDFTDLILVQALRQFLWSFRLPGEAQKIDRMMETFAQRYCQLNPNIFSNPDTCYVLSFAVIILNTSLHNPSVKEKPTLERFIAMNRGINDGKDLPRDILESLYESIKAEPFKIPEDDGNDLMHTFFNPDREGWLWKQGGRYKSWKRRWFILNDNCLYYFEYTTDKEPRGIIPLENIQVREVVDRNKPNCFELYATGGNEFIKACKTDSEGKVVEGKHTVYRMSAAEQSEKDEWIACIRQSISHNPFYDMLAARKKKAQKSTHRTKP